MLKKDQKKIIQQLVHESMTFSRKPQEQTDKAKTTQTSLPSVSFKDILSGLTVEDQVEELPTPSFNSLASIAFEKVPVK